MRRLSIGVRLTLWYLAIFALAQLVFGVGMWFILRHNLFDLVDDGLESQVEDLKTFLEAQKKDASIAKLREEVDEIYAIEHTGDYLEVYAENGELIYRSAFLEQHQSALFPPDEIQRTILRSRRIDRRPFRFILQKLEVNGHVYTVEMGAPADDAVETLYVFRSYMLLFAPLLLLAAAGGGYWLSRRALSPVDALVRTAREISGANLDSRLQKLSTGDELQRLSETLNEMLGRIENAFLRVTQFTADASHELRTPVSLIRTEAELALRRSREESEYREALHHILQEAERMTALIGELLELARSDSGRETLHLQPIDLRETLGRVVESWRQIATARNVGFSATLEPESMFVMGDETALHRVIEILLDNAFKYTPDSGTVHLSLASQGESAALTLRDSGLGIAPEDQAKIFERFYRADKSRSREQGGAGLGLSIAQWIVAQHSGSIEVESHPGTGSVFYVRLPIVAALVSDPQGV